MYRDADGFNHSVQAKQPLLQLQLGNWRDLLGMNAGTTNESAAKLLTISHPHPPDSK